MTRPAILLMFAFTVFGCRETTREADPLRELAALDSIQRKAHYENNAEMLGTIMADSFSVVSKGKVSWSTRPKMVKSFTNYFHSIRYSHWENIDSPLVELGDQLAVVTYHKKTISQAKGSAVTDTAEFAWASVMLRQAGQWKVKGIITTDNQ